MRSSLLLLFVSVVPLLAQTAIESAWSTLDAGLGDKSATERAKAVRSLGTIRNNSKAEADAVKALADPDPSVRAAGAIALGKMGAKSAIPMLENLLTSDTESEVVFASASALRDLGDPKAFNVYYAVLTGERKTGEGLKDSQLKMLKDPKALARIGLDAGIGFVPFGSLATGVFKTLTKDDVSPVRAAAAVQIAHDPDPRSGKALTNALADKKWLVRAAAADALGQRDDAALAKSLEPLFTDSEDTVRFTAAAAFIRLTDDAKPHR
jgi:HEAT repeat protein